MLDIVLKILSVIGIVLLVLLAVLVVTLLLVLFFPITYKAFGKKNEKDIQAWVKANWLFGLLRVRFIYPEPGKLTVKLLWFTLYDAAKSKQEEASSENTNANVQTGKAQTSNVQTGNVQTGNVQTAKPAETSAETKNNPTENSVEKSVNTTSVEKVSVEVKSSQNPKSPSDIPENTEENPSADAGNNHDKKSIKDRILQKYEKIKYTIRKIYDKIKHILENIAFYKNLLQDEQTKGLLQHAFTRLGRILKSIRPRKLKGDILFGTGSPDTTGYVFGIYGMFIPLYGKHMNVTPDFTQAILEGELYAAGHITVFQLLRHGLMLLLDKRLRLLIHRIKTHTI